MAGKYTPDDVSLLAKIRNDVLSRPHAYRDGEDFLRTQYAPARLHQAAMTEGEQDKDHPTQLASYRFIAQEVSQDIADPDEREARFKRELEQLSAPPLAEQWTLAACASRAMQELMQLQGEHHDAKAQAILLLAIMLWDADADKRHPIFAVFGPWGVTPGNQIESLSRWVATCILADEVGLRHWMQTVNMAWTGIARPADTVPVDVVAENGDLTDNIPQVVDALRPPIASFKHPDADYNTADLKDMTGLGNKAINRYTAIAKVAKPAVGKKNHRYTAIETRAILIAIVTKTSELGLKKKCQNALENRL